MKGFAFAAWGRALLAAAFLLAGMAWGTPAQAADPAVKLETSMGDIIVRLDARKAPMTVTNFLEYVKAGFYDGTTFHRVIKGFMIQGGGMGPDMKEKPARAPIKNEASNGLKNSKYTIAMARTSEPHSATSQFFINVANNAFLDYKAQTPQGWGYAVFGKVIKGQDVVDKIASVPTDWNDKPKTPVKMKTVELIEG